jgi:hypothetical protein|tara:strand:- start:336 stop:683 length:348 start_codon:yes stop_codon:yes gene_type:complete
MGLFFGSLKVETYGAIKMFDKYTRIILTIIALNLTITTVQSLNLITPAQAALHKTPSETLSDMEFNIEMLLMGQNTNNSWLESIGADVSSFKKDIKNTRVLTGVIVKQLSELETK